MASTSAERSNNLIEQCNMQTTWLVPTKFKLLWKIEDACGFEEFKSPKMYGPAGTEFTVFLRNKDAGNYFVEMESLSDRAPLKIKGEISVNNAEYLQIKRTIKKRFDTKKLQIPPVSMQENNSLEIDLEFIAFPVFNQFLKVNKNAAQFGEKLKDFVTENVDGCGLPNLVDCSLYSKSEKVLFRCHKAVMAARSPKLDSWLEMNDFVPISVLQNCNDSIVQGLIDYLYMANPYKLIEKCTLRNIKEISKLGQLLEVSGIESLFEERDYSIVSKNHHCSTVFEATMTNKEFFQLKSETSAIIEFPNFTFCKSKWTISLVKKELLGNEKYLIDLKKSSKESGINVEVHVSYLNLKDWVELPKVTHGLEADDKKTVKMTTPKSKKRKLTSVSKNIHDSNDDFVFEIENECLEELFKSPISSLAEKFKKLVLKCEIKHKKFYDSVDLKVKTFDAFRFLYDWQHFLSFSADLKKLYDSKKYADLKLTVTSCLQSKEFQVHKIILAARSSVFKQIIIESGDGEIEIKTEKHLWENFDQIICFLYTSEIDFELISPLRVYEFAFRNSVIDLMNSARIYLTEHLSENIANSAVKAAIQCEDDIFKEDVKNYMGRHHSKKWDPDTNKFIPKPENPIKRSYKNMDTGTLDTDTETFTSETDETLATVTFTSGANETVDSETFTSRANEMGDSETFISGANETMDSETFTSRANNAVDSETFTSGANETLKTQRSDNEADTEFESTDNSADDWKLEDESLSADN